MNQDFGLPLGSAFSTAPRSPLSLIQPSSGWRRGYPSWCHGWSLGHCFMYLSPLFSTANIHGFFKKICGWAFSPKMQQLQSKKCMLLSLPLILLTFHCHWLSSLFLFCSWYFPWGDTPRRWEIQRWEPGTSAWVSMSAHLCPSCPSWSSISPTTWLLLWSFCKILSSEGSSFCSASWWLVHTPQDTQ